MRNQSTAEDIMKQFPQLPKREVAEMLTRFSFSDATWGMHWSESVSEVLVDEAGNVGFVVQGSEWSEDGGGVARYSELGAIVNGKLYLKKFAPYRHQFNPNQDNNSRYFHTITGLKIKADKVIVVTEKREVELEKLEKK